MRPWEFVVNSLHNIGRIILLWFPVVLATGKVGSLMPWHTDLMHLFLFPVNYNDNQIGCRKKELVFLWVCWIYQDFNPTRSWFMFCLIISIRLCKNTPTDDVLPDADQYSYSMRSITHMEQRLRFSAANFWLDPDQNWTSGANPDNDFLEKNVVRTLYQQILL